jgi:hypothetical protein
MWNDLINCVAAGSEREVDKRVVEGELGEGKPWRWVIWQGILELRRGRVVVLNRGMDGWRIDALNYRVRWMGNREHTIGQE